MKMKKKNNEDNKEEENVEYNPELYEEDIGNIDFDEYIPSRSPEK